MWNHLKTQSRFPLRFVFVALFLLSLSSMSLACQACGLPAHFQELKQTYSERRGNNDVEQAEAKNESERNEKTEKEDSKEENPEFHGMPPH